MKFTDDYPLKPFQADDPGRLHKVISEYPLATVISQGPEFPAVSQLPLVLDSDRNVLQGHLDRNNPHANVLMHGGNVYALFNGPNHYMSPAIYPDSQYPGWNYVSVHVEGVVETIKDSGWLTELLLRTAEQNEPADSGYRLKPTQRGFDSLVRYIVGFEIKIMDIRGIFKLAQDKGAGHACLARDHLSTVVSRDASGFIDAMLAVSNSDGPATSESNGNTPGDSDA